MLRRLTLAAALAAGVARGDGIAWRPWSSEVFAQAKRENKLVILDLEAVWCHWCHVMDSTTYSDPQIIGLLGSRYLAVRVDQDSRPDLASRYENYGWPATVIFAADGTEIVKKQGYIPPEGMARLLKTVIADPSPVDYGNSIPEQPAASPTVLSADRRTALRRQWLNGYDKKAGGWGFSHKFLDWDSVELALREAARSDAKSARRARETLRLQRKLVDPVWGGVYQYSVGGDWNEPHFEKIMPMQAENLRIYALAYAQWGDATSLETARSIHRYIGEFLRSPDGPFYTSQDADLSPGAPGADYFALDNAGRRARGIPRVDKHIYARENGWAAAALAQLSAMAGDAEAGREAVEAVRWVQAHRALPSGGFSHGEADPAGPYLEDTLAMGRAFFALYQLTADSSWLERATESARFIGAHFARGAAPGFAASDATRASFPPPQPEFDENVAVARFAAALATATGRVEFREMAAAALRWLLAPGLAEGRGTYVAGLLLAEEEARTDPLHVAVVGRKSDSAAQALFLAALRAPTAHKLVEWWDPSEGPAPRGEAIYPELDRAAAFICDHGACSAPVFDTAAIAARLAKASL